MFDRLLTKFRAWLKEKSDIHYRRIAATDKVIEAARMLAYKITMFEETETEHTSSSKPWNISII